MASVEKRSFSVEGELMAWAEREASAEGIAVSQLVSLALARLRDQRRAEQERAQAWAEWMAEYEAARGPISAEADAAAARELGYE